MNALIRTARGRRAAARCIGSRRETDNHADTTAAAGRAKIGRHLGKDSGFGPIVPLRRF